MDLGALLVKAQVNELRQTLQLGPARSAAQVREHVGVLKQVQQAVRDSKCTVTVTIMDRQLGRAMTPEVRVWALKLRVRFQAVMTGCWRLNVCHMFTLFSV